MFVIRRDQMVMFEEEVLRGFTRELAGHFREHLPDHYAALGDEGTRAAIRRGVKKGQGYGIVSPMGLTIFVRMMFLLGEEFDVDPELPWAAEILNDPAMLVESEKIARMDKACLAFLKSISQE